MTSIYIKPSKRKCSISDFNCFDIYDDIYDEDKVKIAMTDCDVISIECSGKKYYQVNMEVIDGMTHIWSWNSLEFVPVTNTLIIRFKEENND